MHRGAVGSWAATLAGALDAATLDAGTLDSSAIHARQVRATLRSILWNFMGSLHSPRCRSRASVGPFGATPSRPARGGRRRRVRRRRIIAGPAREATVAGVGREQALATDVQRRARDVLVGQQGPAHASEPAPEGRPAEPVPARDPP